MGDTVAGYSSQNKTVGLALAATARRQAFQAAQEGRFEAALEMTPSSCLQERSVAQFADGSKELHPPVIQHG